MMGHKIVGLSAGVLAWVILAFGLDAIAAQLGLQDILWPYVGLALWPIRVISVAGAVGAGWFLAKWTARRNRPARIALVALATLLLVVEAFLGTLWQAFGTIETDYRLVSPAMLHDWLPGFLQPPPGARRVRVTLTGGISPCAWLRFEAPPQEAEQYVAAALRLAAERGLRDDDGQFARGWRPTNKGSDTWWKPEDEGPWWRVGEPNETLFIQRHSDGRTVFVKYQSE